MSSPVMFNAVKRSWPWLRLLIGLGILTALLWWHSTDAFVDALHAIDTGAVVIALAVGLATTVLSAARWWLVAQRLGLHLPLSAAVADYYKAQFLNAVLPAGVLGDVHRAVSHGHRSGDVARGVRAVFLERIAGQGVAVVAGVLALFAHPALLSAMAPALLPAGVVLGVVLVLARWRHRALTSTFADLRAVLGAWPSVVALSVAALAGHLALFVVAARLVGSTAPLLTLLPLLLLALLVMVLPVNVGGWGPREAVLALAFGAAGLGSAQGLTVSVVYGVLSFIACLPGAGTLLLKHREHVPERLDKAAQRVPALAGAGQ
ncbi:lysylphosphatidylglycerol synthase transmembrane domain-containing protein [Actinomadura madurae]|uniref:lysylphosphatidylglycerol synthase transmembrane domain-containing protein n=1 Tax=Actinomadura madurae TaxID=1993 RepID=UPI0020D2307B|nr:lysylphosphatidylglycerol synthase transmembrane domain-containing protein [Actinomadura madurae]MCP9949152.1 flippase-like domain-containing protein [Actinomadura madurae]MCQ0014601.1 flippase-like domain-containing protein [Actinomadura madurae]